MSFGNANVVTKDESLVKVTISLPMDGITRRNA